MFSQAFAAWRWWNHYEVLGQRKTMLRVNMDESPICLHQGKGEGTIVLDRKRHREEAVQRVSRKTRRRHMTLVAFICDREDIQLVLPQVLILNEATCPLRTLLHLRAAVSPNILIVRQKSAWNNEHLCADIIRRLGKAIAPFKHLYQPVLLMDAAKMHTSKTVVLACRASNIWPLLIPAGLTWLLQPLDTHGFSPFKNVLAQLYQAARVSSTNQELDIQEFLGCVSEAVNSVLCGRGWKRAFERCGFGLRQAQVAKSTFANLGVEECEVLATMPSWEEIHACFPRRTRAASLLFWRVLETVSKPDAEFSMRTPVHSSRPNNSGAETIDHAMGRTRSQTRALLSYPRAQP